MKLRDLIFVEEMTQQPWAKQMQTVLLDLKGLTDEARAAGLAGLPQAVIEQGRVYACLAGRCVHLVTVGEKWKHVLPM